MNIYVSKMEKPRLLSGAEIVARGITKIDVTLPPIGQKDVVPSGTWLEQKQIQSALEARKHMIEVQRIEKSGVLSQAEWREELMLAEVSKIVGGHWQYIGHNVGKTLYLNPEEALFLIEVNCLRLTYNGLIVSLQQAYSLLLRSEIAVLQYQVYASLSRIGYKVYRHEDKSENILTECENKLVQTENIKKEIPISNQEIEMKEVENTKENKMDVDNAQNGTASNKTNECDKEIDVPGCPNKDIVVNKGENKMGDEDTDNKNTTDKGKKCDKEVNTAECQKRDIFVNKEGHEMAVDNIHNGNTINESNECDKDVNVSPKEHIVEMQESNPKEEAMKVEDNNCNETVTDKVEVMCVIDNNTEEMNVYCDKTSETEKISCNSNETNGTETKEENMITDISSTEGENNVKTNLENVSKENELDNTLESTSNDIEMENLNNIKSKVKEKKDVSNNEENAIDISSQSQPKMSSVINNTRPELYHQHKINILENRKSRPLDVKKTEKYFDKVPDLSKNQIVTVNAPEESFIPRNVFLNNISYTLNLESIKSKTKGRGQSNSSRAFSTHEDVSGDHIRRIKAAATPNIPVTSHPPPPFVNNSFNRPNFFNFWRPNVNFFPYNFMFQRQPFVPFNFMPRFRAFNPRPSLLGEYPRFASFQSNEQRSEPTQSRKRRISAKQKETHLQAITNLALRLKGLIKSGNTQQSNIVSLQRLINTFNLKYGMRLRLTEDFDLFNNETIVDTITLDEDEEPSSKKSKSDDNKYKKNLNSLKELALKLKELETKQKATSRHRRAFSNLIKKFNKSYNADIYINNHFEIKDRKLISLDSSSDSDCVIEESTKATGSKKLKNPFNILKRLSEKQYVATTSNTNEDGTNGYEMKIDSYSTTTIESFGKNWLPSEDDFGRAEILPKRLMYSYLLHSKREEYLYEFIKSQPYEFENWIDIKLSFLKSIEETDNSMEIDMTDTTAVNTLVTPEDCAGTHSVLKKLSIISTNKEVDNDSSLKIDFDVYNRDVQNFKKTDRPKPHFRVICISESSSFPSGKDVASLHSKYEDNTTIVFAIVGMGSISYLQINPHDLPIYIPTSDLE